MHVNRQLGSIAKLMKLRYLYYYAQAHSRICCVLITLQPLYGQAHAPYDQTHGPYAEAHIFQELGVARNYLNSHPLTTFGELLSSSYMEWLMVWLNLTQSLCSRPLGTTRWLVWCVPANKNLGRTWASS